MQDVTIRRCVLRVVRRGGWSWGEDCQRWIDDATRALPALLAAELERLLPPGAEGEVSRPLHMDVRVSMSELRAWATRAQREESAAPARDGAVREGDELRLALRTALARAPLSAGLKIPASAGVPPEGEVASKQTSSSEAGVASATRDVATSRACALANLLLSWRALGELEALLRALPREVIEAWHRVLLGPAEPVTHASPATQAQHEHEAHDDDATRTLAPFVHSAKACPPAELLLLRLLGAVELAASLGFALTAPDTRRTLNAHLTLPPFARASAAVTPSPARRSDTRRTPHGSELRVASALPFLLLGPLERIGWLDALDATFAGAALEHLLPALAVALAHKVLPVPERGWRRAAPALAVAAAFAGDAETRPDPELSTLTRAVASLAPGLDVIVRRALIDGRCAADPLLLVSEEAAPRSARLLVDPEGVFFIAHAATPELLARFAREAKSPLFIPAAEADAVWLSELDARGVRFVTPAPPARGEPWQIIAGSRAPRLYANYSAGELPGCIATQLNPSAERVQNAWQQLARRPLPGRSDDDPALACSLALAAGLALGTISWTLWREREPTCPALALERFQDLEASVRFEPSVVRVRLALGKRFRDLHAAGLLRDVPRVPWLDGRSVVFSGG